MKSRGDHDIGGDYVLEGEQALDGYRD